MVRRLVVAMLAIPLAVAAAHAENAGVPVPLYPGALPRPMVEPPPASAAAGETAPVPSASAPPASAVAVPLLPLGAAASGAAASGDADSGDADSGAAGSGAADSGAAGPGRVFCDDTVTALPADPDRVPARYRRFVGIWSDASWTPQRCAALIVQTVAPDGTATITYAFGPMDSDNGGPKGVLHGTGIIRDGELRFQNADGSQFSFRPLYADLEGRLTTPQGKSYGAIFKRTP